MRDGLETLNNWLSASLDSRRPALQNCLERIESLDRSIQAWVQVQPQKPTAEGTLSGIPFGAKDIIETRGLATEYGSPIYKGRTGTSDAYIVSELNRRGAILLGKTHCAAFAHKTPPPTRNPRDPDHTPGGSSSGSAAAVAAGMVPLAIGTQTKGSVLRPASYCGITGFKPSYGLLSLDGVLPFSKSLDTLGFFTSTAADMLSFWQALDQPVGRPEDFPVGVVSSLPDLDSAMAAAFENSVSLLRHAGVVLRPLDLAGMLSRLSDAADTVMYYEGARLHRERFQRYGSRLEDLADLVREGLQISEQTYDDARQFIAKGRDQFAELYNATLAILTPAATGPAPRGLASTGDPRMNAPWTALGTPAISIPMPIKNGLPLGLQITTDHGQDGRLLQAAVRFEHILDRR
ncbi:MAG: amidase [Candidatus Korobacteraceae bacterium]